MTTSFQINQALPVEIFTIIFSFINPSPEDSYPHFPLSWVCRHWRRIIIDDPRFWAILKFQGTYGRKSFLKQLVHRSKSHKIHIIVSPSPFDYELSFEHEPPTDSSSKALMKYIPSESHSRVRSLFFHSEIITRDWLDLTFPQLETLSLVTNMRSTNNSLIKLITASSLRHIELSSSTLDIFDKEVLRHLSNIEWLSLNLEEESQPKKIFETLSTELPNLQILNISGPGLLQNAQTITLPKVRILTLENVNPIQFPFNVPSLDYLCLLRCRPPHAFGMETMDAQLGSIDLSQIIHVRVGFHEHMIHDVCGLDDHSRHDLCMTGMTHSSVDCASFERFHKEGMISQAIAIENNLPPKNTFHIPIPGYPLLTCALLQRMTNLTELTLDYGSIKYSHKYLPSFNTMGHILLGAGTIVRLNIMHTRGFVDACSALKRGEAAPCLERLTCHSSSRIKETAFLPRHIKHIQEARVKATSRPLKILELRNFSVIPEDRLKEIAKMGIRVIQ